MNLEELAKEWKEIQVESISHLPTDAPYPPRITARRELLLFLQVELEHLEKAIRNKDASQEFHSHVYKVAKRLYESMA